MFIIKHSNHESVRECVHKTVNNNIYYLAPIKVFVNESAILNNIIIIELISINFNIVNFLLPPPLPMKLILKLIILEKSSNTCCFPFFYSIIKKNISK